MCCPLTLFVLCSLTTHRCLKNCLFSVNKHHGSKVTYTSVLGISTCPGVLVLMSVTSKYYTGPQPHQRINHGPVGSGCPVWYFDVPLKFISSWLSTLATFMGSRQKATLQNVLRQNTTPVIKRHL